MASDDEADVESIIAWLRRRQNYDGYGYRSIFKTCADHLERMSGEIAALRTQVKGMQREPVEASPTLSKGETE